MNPPNSDKPANERELTDASLLAERARTDEEIANARASVEEDADRIVAVARERAEALLVAAREQADQGLAAAGAGLRVKTNVEVERAVEDEAVARERAVADAQLLLEREEGQKAISELLRLERAATDEGLLIERARADDVVQSRDDFLGMVSHDLRTLLGGIAMSASMLAKHAAAQEGDALAQNHAERIQRFTARMTRLVGDLLDVVSLEAGRLHVAPLPNDAAALVTEAVDAFQPSFVAKGVALTAEPAADAILTRFDHDRLFQVLANLLSNALKFTEKGGAVAVRVLRVGADVRFSVTDTGVGIPEGQAAVIFERFRQLNAHDRRGLGLGLYIARSIVEAHGGVIWAESPRAGGTTLYFTLPSDSP